MRVFSNNFNLHSNSGEDFRSHFLKYLQRDREPSRIPVKQLVQVLNKQRKFGICRYIRINIPSKLKIHHFTRAFSNERQRLNKRSMTFTQDGLQIIKGNFPNRIPIKNKSVFCFAQTKDATTRFESVFGNISGTFIVLA